MSQEAFRLVSRAMRYVFILIAGLYVLLTAVWMLRDRRLWKKQKKLLPDAGTVGELVDEDSLRRFPVPREGTVGSGPRCDIRIIGRGVRRRHADVRFVDGKGLMIIPDRGRKVTVDGTETSSPVCAGRGSRIRFGSAVMTLRLFEGVEAPAAGVYAQEEEYDPLTAVVPGAEEGWSQVIPLPEDRIDGGDDGARDEGDGPEIPGQPRPFDFFPVMPENGGCRRKGADDGEE